jgi:hypothetical protein
VVTALSVIALVWVTARLLARWGADPLLALVLLATPGVIVDLTWVGPEALGAALVLVGLGRVLGGVSGRGRGGIDPSRHGSGSGDSMAADPLVADPLVTDRLVADPLGIAAFAAAGLCRESLLLVPAVLVLLFLVDRRVRRAAMMAAAAAPYAVWVVFLRVRIGAWPTGSEGGRISLMPFGGLVRAMPGWGIGDIVFAVVVLGGAAAALAVVTRRELRWLIVAHVVLAASLGAQVWTRFADFGRVLLPLTALSLVALALHQASRRADTNDDDLQDGRTGSAMSRTLAS